MKRFKNSTGSLIADVRKRRHMQQRKLAELVGISRTSISNIEQGNQSVTLDTFCKIARALDYKPAELLDAILLHSTKASLTIPKSEIPDELIRKQVIDAIKSKELS